MPRRRPLDRGLLLALLIAGLVLLPRAFLIARAHSETYDEGYHLSRGVRFWSKDLADVPLNDPPLGEGLAALPLMAARVDLERDPERTLLLTHLWMSILFLPAAGIAFAWCRSLYGARAGWLALLLLLIEPTFAAHVPLATLDALGVSGALIGSFLLWRAFEAPTAARLVAAAVAVAAALMLKHTTLALLGVAAGFGLLFWVVRQIWRDGRSEFFGAQVRALRPRLMAIAAALLVGLLALWALTLFDVSTPHPMDDWGRPAGNVPSLLQRQVPGGLYLTALFQGLAHAGQGHFGYLFGERRLTGWWYYFPALLLYKVPLGVAVLIGLALLSLRWHRPRFEEWGLVVPLAAWTTLMMSSRVDIGFRHFLPAWIFALLLASRCLARGDGAVPAPRWVAAAAWSGLAATALHVASFHPDYISYINIPRDRPWLAISDSNLDWGQGLKQVRSWLDEHPQPPDRPVRLLYFGDDASGRRIERYLDRRVSFALRPEPLPERGLVIASPVWVAGPYDPANLYAPLRALTPVDVIGHSMLVYDLDHREQHSGP